MHPPKIDVEVELQQADKIKIQDSVGNNPTPIFFGGVQMVRHKFESPFVLESMLGSTKMLGERKGRKRSIGGEKKCFYVLFTSLCYWYVFVPSYTYKPPHPPVYLVPTRGGKDLRGSRSNGHGIQGAGVVNRL